MDDLFWRMWPFVADFLVAHRLAMAQELLNLRTRRILRTPWHHWRRITGPDPRRPWHTHFESDTDTDPEMPAMVDSSDESLV